MEHSYLINLLNNIREYKFELQVLDRKNEINHTFVISAKGLNAYDAKTRMEYMVEDWMYYKYDVQVDYLDVTDLKLLSIEGLEECQ